MVHFVPLQQVAQVHSPRASIEPLFFAHLDEVPHQVLAVFLGQNHQHARDSAVPVEPLFEVEELDVEFLGLACGQFGVLEKVGLEE